MTRHDRFQVFLPRGTRRPADQSLPQGLRSDGDQPDSQAGHSHAQVPLCIGLPALLEAGLVLARVEVLASVRDVMSLPLRYEKRPRVTRLRQTSDPLPLLEGGLRREIGCDLTWLAGKRPQLR